MAKDEITGTKPTLGIHLIRLRNRHNIPRSRLARLLGISYQLVGHIETGTRLPTLHLLNKLINYFTTVHKDKSSELLLYYYYLSGGCHKASNYSGRKARLVSALLSTSEDEIDRIIDRWERIQDNGVSDTLLHLCLGLPVKFNDGTELINCILANYYPEDKLCTIRYAKTEILSRNINIDVLLRRSIIVFEDDTDTVTYNNSELGFIIYRSLLGNIVTDGKSDYKVLNIVVGNKLSKVKKSYVAYTDIYSGERYGKPLMEFYADVVLCEDWFLNTAKYPY